MAQFWADTFDGVDATELTAYSAGWMKTSSSPGTVVLLANRAKHNGGANVSNYYRGDITPPSADYTVRGKFYFGAQSGSGASVGVFGRGLSTSQNYYLARFVIGTGLVLVKLVAATASTLGTYPYTPVADTEAIVDLKMVGDQISVYLNDVLVLGPVTDTSFTAAGYPGMRLINSSLQVQISEMSADDGVTVGGVNGTAVVTGVSAAASVGTVAASAGAQAAPAGVAATASVDFASASAGTNATASPAGVSASATVGTVAATAGARAAPAGAAATSQVGPPVVSAGGGASPVGVSAIAQVGSVTAVGGSASTAMPAGVSASASVGLPITDGGASIAVPGVSASATVGQASASVGGNGIAGAAGVGASAVVGTASGSGSANSSPAGVTGFAPVGAVIAAGNIAIPAIGSPLGVTAYGRVGAATATGSGLFARAPSGSGYSPQRNEHQARPQQNYEPRMAQVSGTRSSAIEKAYR